MANTKSARVSTSLVDRALIERVRARIGHHRKMVEAGVREYHPGLPIEDDEALCALAEDVLDRCWALNWLLGYHEFEDAEPIEQDVATALRKILSHVTAEEGET